MPQVLPTHGGNFAKYEEDLMHHRRPLVKVDSCKSWQPGQVTSTLNLTEKRVKIRTNSTPRRCNNKYQERI